ncbi:MAG TPA: tetratricopeptide repeat protein [Chitinophagaceae bacterium]|jgi:Ca-activated chloride channel family protein|nr:tetratricopeptide repeat protein [Chitinophagaceae bacterium]
MRNLLIIFLLIVPADLLFAQEENNTIVTGNNYYRQQQYDKAEAEYRKVLQATPDNKTAKFNLANALIKLDKKEDADKLLTELSAKDNKADLRSKATYNQGVMLSQQKKLEESIEAYKETLRLNPNDKEARENLQKALLELKKKNPPKKQEQKKKEQQKQQPKPKISPREAQQQLKLLEQKEKQVQERLQKNSKTGNSLPKDW